MAIEGSGVGQAQLISNASRAVIAVHAVAGDAEPGDALGAQVADGRRRSWWWAWRAVAQPNRIITSTNAATPIMMTMFALSGSSRAGR